MSITCFGGTSRWALRAAALGALLAWLCLSPAYSSAQAAEIHPFLFSFGGFTNPNGIAVDETDGDVYVADIGTQTVYKFDEHGNAVAFSSLGGNALSGSATPAKAFAFPSEYGNPAALAIDNSTSASDPSAGDLYVLDLGHEAIDKFGPSGAYIGQIAGFSAKLFGFGVETNGDVRVYLEQGTVDLFDDALVNGLMREMPPAEDEGVAPADGFAVGPGGDQYLLRTCHCVRKEGTNHDQLGEVDDEASGADVALAVDPATGHLYIDDQSSVSEWDTGEMNGKYQKPLSFEIQATGALVATFGGLQLSGSSGEGGIAVNGKTGEIYVSNPADGTVQVFSSTSPDVALSKPASVGQSEAMLEGSIDPRGGALASCRFEYEATATDPTHFLTLPVTGFGHSVPCEQSPAQIGSGTAPVRVSAKVGGLQAGKLYDARLVAEGAGGGNFGGGRFATEGPGFGLKSFEVAFVNQDGSPDVQAGSHPYEMTTNIAMNTAVLPYEPTADSQYYVQPDGGTFKDLVVDLPPGLVGDPNATGKKCSLKEMDATGEHLGESIVPGLEPCPVESVIGELEIEFGANRVLGGILKEPVYNLIPPHGVAAEIGSHFLIPNVFVNVGVLAGGDYPVQAVSAQAPVVEPVIATRMTVFGVVGSGATRKAFLTLPTACNGPLRSSIAADSYESPGHYATANAVTRDAAGQPVGLSGCSKLVFPPTIGVSPDTSDASTSSGLTVGVHVSQTAAQNPDGLAESSLRDTTVTLPEGVAINPAGADGLEACSEGLAGFTGFGEFNGEAEPGAKTATFTSEMPSPIQPGVNFCPDGSKIGTVKIKTPLLEHELEGAVYLAAQNANPFGSLVAMYLIAEDGASGTVLKLTGEVHLTETGQIVTTFENTPDLPFEELQLHFFGGERAPLTTPSRCGTYTTKAVFTPWDGNGPVTSESSFNIDHGPNGAPCPGAGLPFAPSLTAGTTSNQSGGFSPFTMTMSREDGQQNLQAISLKMPPGLSGLLTGVELCGEAQANAGTCGPNSQIGETTVSVGVGNDPFTVKGGRVYLTGPYKGAPFGLSIVNPAKAGPYDVEHDTSNPNFQPACDCLVVRAKIEVDPHTAELTVTSDNEGPYKIPTTIDGIPLEIKHVNVTIDRPGFTFNPTNCEKLSIGGALDSTEGGVSSVSLPFQATNCAALGFAPKFAVSTSGKASRLDGTSLNVKLTYPKAAFGSQANIKQVKVELPRLLPSRLPTLQKACTAAQFHQNPAGCPAASVVGHGKAITPLVPVPLEGPAYFVSNGGEAFPNLIVVLQGYGVRIDLVGDTFISKAGVTSSTFKTVPDAPVGSFELSLPAGPYSALTTAGNLCTAKSLVMPTEFLAQNGAQIHKQTKIAVAGCPKHRTVKHKRKPKRKQKHRTVKHKRKQKAQAPPGR